MSTSLPYVFRRDVGEFLAPQAGDLAEVLRDLPPNWEVWPTGAGSLAVLNTDPREDDSVPRWYAGFVDLVTMVYTPYLGAPGAQRQDRTHGPHDPFSPGSDGIRYVGKPDHRRVAAGLILMLLSVVAPEDDPRLPVPDPAEWPVAATAEWDEAGDSVESQR